MTIQRSFFPAAILVLLVLVPSTLAATGVGESAALPATRVVTDGLGRSVEIPAQPRRIVTAGRAQLMTINAVWAFEDAPERMYAVGNVEQGRGTFLADWDADWDRLTILDRSAGPEQVASLAPDLVILKSVVRANLGEPLERLGVPVIYVDLENPEQYQRDLRVLAAVVIDPVRGEELADFFRNTAAAVERSVSAAAATQPTTLMIYHRVSGGDVSFSVPPAGWIQTEMVNRAGGDPVWLEANPGRGWATVSFEQIALWNPEVIILIEYSGQGLAIRDRLAAQPRWQELQAVREGRFLVMPMDYYSWDQPDVRWILGLQWTAWALHGVVPPGGMDAQVRRFYSTLYGMDQGDFDRLIAPTLTGDLP